MADDEWVLHAASQDLPCLAELGMRPTRVFDTELAGRLLGYARVGLGSIVEEVLGLTLEKGHSAADWSTRPLPEPWLRYAALDVEVLVELRDALAEQLDEQGKRSWAEEEFAAIVAAPPAAPRFEPWRRTGGLHRVRKRRPLAVVRALWERRDEVARRRDIAPGRVLPDAAIVEAALAAPRTEAELVALPVWGGRSMRRQTATWLPAIEAALALPEADLPGLKTPVEGPPPARSLARARPGSRRSAGRRPGGPRRGRGRAPPAGREPARAGHGAPPHVDTAGRCRHRGRRRRPARPRRPLVAGRAHRRRARRGARVGGCSHRRCGCRRCGSRRDGTAAAGAGGATAGRRPCRAARRHAGTGRRLGRRRGF